MNDPSRDDGDADDVSRWQQFSSGQMPSVAVQTEPRERTVHTGPWEVVASALAVAAAFLVLGPIVQGFDFTGAIRDRAFLAAGGGHPVFAAAIALAAIATEAAAGGPWVRNLGRWASVCARIVAVTLLATATYSIAYLLFAHPHVANAPDNVAELLARSLTTGWSARFAHILEAAAGGVLAAAALYLHHRVAAAPTVSHERTDLPTP